MNTLKISNQNEHIFLWLLLRKYNPLYKEIEEYRSDIIQSQSPLLMSEIDSIGNEHIIYSNLNIHNKNIYESSFLYTFKNKLSFSVLFKELNFPDWKTHNWKRISEKYKLTLEIEGK